VVGSAVLARVGHIGAWPSGYLDTLQFDSANAARTIWITLTGVTQPWQQAWLHAHAGRFIEPPVLQFLTALTYLPDGIERPWTSQLFDLVIWFGAAAFLYDAVRHWTDRWGALLALAYILLAPFAIIISTNFQVEPMLVLSFASVAWYSSRGDVTEQRRLPIAALVGAWAGLSKPGVLLPFVSALYLVSAIEGRGIADSLRDRRRVLRYVGLMVLVAAPALTYTILVIPSQVGDKVLPQLLLTTGFYIGWAENVAQVIGIVPFAGAVLGFVLTLRLRRLGLALGLTYLAYGAIFTWHTETHVYYQVPAMVIVAIGLGGLGQWVGSIIVRSALAPRSAVAVALALSVPLTYIVAPHHLIAATPGEYSGAAVMRRVGIDVGSGTWVVAYTENYGKPLMFYGRVLVDAWPTSSDLVYYSALGWRPLTVAQQLGGFITEHHDHYFVLTELPPETAALRAFLNSSYLLVDSSPSLRIYDLTKPLRAGVPVSSGTG
jgi:Dolichyl-phosphate-mannose-protein mannosyltransferase